uniref:hypothetical protein n=1 Tax=Streptomyces sp. CA-141956 TaxID=3240051 RepID=UPI003F49AC82
MEKTMDVIDYLTASRKRIFSILTLAVTALLMSVMTFAGGSTHAAAEDAGTGHSNHAWGHATDFG